MIRHFRHVRPSSAPKAAVRDLQNQSRRVKLSRTSETGIVVGLRGTHVRSLGTVEETTATTADVVAPPRWG